MDDHNSTVVQGVTCEQIGHASQLGLPSDGATGKRMDQWPAGIPPSFSPQDSTVVQIRWPIHAGWKDCACCGGC